MDRVGTSRVRNGEVTDMELKDIQSLGLLIFLHDAKDAGKFDRLHHWMLGIAMIFWPEWFKHFLSKE